VVAPFALFTPAEEAAGSLDLAGAAVFEAVAPLAACGV